MLLGSALLAVLGGEPRVDLNVDVRCVVLGALVAHDGLLVEVVEHHDQHRAASGPENVVCTARGKGGISVSVSVS